jgi:hypothetical protein
MAIDDSYTKSLFHFDGTDTSTTITDESGKVWTVNGSAQLDTAIKEFGSASLMLEESTTDSLYLASNTDFSFDADFTIDCWIYLQDTNNDYAVIFGSANTSWEAGCTLMQLRGYPNCYLSCGYNGGTFVESTAGGILPFTWYHVALVRSGTTTKIYINGVNDGTITSDSGTWTFNSNGTYIGADGWDGAGAYLGGWIDEFRVSKGVARWTDTFDVPTSPYTRYTRGNYASLPTGSANLETVYSAQNITDVSSKNDVRVAQTGASEYMIHQFEEYVGDKTSSFLEWEGQTDLDPSTSTVYLQIYNRTNTTWDQVSSYSTSTVNTDFTLSGTVADLTNYKDAANVISCRVYQQAI